MKDYKAKDYLIVIAVLMVLTPLCGGLANFIFAIKTENTFFAGLFGILGIMSGILGFACFLCGCIGISIAIDEFDKE